MCYQSPSIIDIVRDVLRVLSRGFKQMVDGHFLFFIISVHAIATGAEYSVQSHLNGVLSKKPHLKISVVYEELYRQNKKMVPSLSL